MARYSSTRGHPMSVYVHIWSFRDDGGGAESFMVSGKWWHRPDQSGKHQQTVSLSAIQISCSGWHHLARPRIPFLLQSWILFQNQQDSHRWETWKTTTWQSQIEKLGSKSCVGWREQIQELTGKIVGGWLGFLVWNQTIFLSRLKLCMRFFKVKNIWLGPILWQAHHLQGWGVL